MAALIVLATGIAMVVVGYRLGSGEGLLVMALGALAASLGLRLLFDAHGAAGPDAERPSERLGDGWT